MFLRFHLVILIFIVISFLHLYLLLIISLFLLTGCSLFKSDALEGAEVYTTTYPVNYLIHNDRKLTYKYTYENEAFWFSEKTNWSQWYWYNAWEIWCMILEKEETINSFFSRAFVRGCFSVNLLQISPKRVILMTISIV